MTVTVHIQNESTKEFERLVDLLDPAAEPSFITSIAARRLHLQTQREQILKFCTFGGRAENINTHRIHVPLFYYNGEFIGVLLFTRPISPPHLIRTNVTWRPLLHPNKNAHYRLRKSSKQYHFRAPTRNRLLYCHCRLLFTSYPTPIRSIPSTNFLRSNSIGATANSERFTILESNAALTTTNTFEDSLFSSHGNLTKIN